MSATSQISVYAFVTREEQEGIRQAADQVADVMTRSAGTQVDCNCEFADVSAHDLPERSTCVLTSLLDETAHLKQSWTEVEGRLRSRYTALSQHGKPVFICTVFRLVDRQWNPVQRQALIIRIRQLNCLAIRLSHELGVYVIDLDRALSVPGARRLQTDFRMAGAPAIARCVRTIASTIIANGLETSFPPEVLQSAEKYVTMEKGTNSQKSRSERSGRFWKGIVRFGRNLLKKRIIWLVL